MDTRSILGVFESVVDVYNYRIAPVGKQCWTRDGSVHSHGCSGNSIGCNRYFRQIEPIFSGYSCIRDN